MEFMMGGIIMFGGNFAPKDWAFCDGQLIAISQNQALYAILGNIWGGDGRTNFALPDMRSRVPIGIGRGVGLTEVYQGQMRGIEAVTLNAAHMATHSHEATFTGTGGGGAGATATAVVNVAATATTTTATGNFLAGPTVPSGKDVIHANGFASASDTTLSTDAVQVTVTGGSGITGGNVYVQQSGSSQPFSIQNPNLGMPYLVALQGIFPSRN